ncbi:hypothetical protein E2C01_043612 [Portunus trituberculatus]|uniref:Uncharacterized protein n=1 Tax=Portunus trituberculatus TaxID=210409 RepID=A0A5B7FY13_PORTR|nr:hypothetical protein [Portunus trituberculatus]
MTVLENSHAASLDKIGEPRSVRAALSAAAWCALRCGMFLFIAVRHDDLRCSPGTRAPLPPHAFVVDRNRESVALG